MIDHVYDGLPISEGIAFGPVRLVRWRVPKVPHRMVSQRGVEAEVERFREALVWADRRLHEVRDSTEGRLGKMMKLLVCILCMSLTSQVPEHMHVATIAPYINNFISFNF